MPEGKDNEADQHQSADDGDGQLHRRGLASARLRQQRQLPRLRLGLGLVGEVGWIDAGEAVIRKKIHEKLMAHGVQLGVVIHPENYPEETATIGGGTIIQGTAAPGPDCKIGQCVLLQGHSIMGHDVEIGDYSTISSFAFIGGNTVIGEGTYIAPGAMLRNGLRIGKNCIIGMGSVVTKDIPDNSVAFGNPCKVTRENTNGFVFKK